MEGREKGRGGGRGRRKGEGRRRDNSIGAPSTHSCRRLWWSTSINFKIFYISVSVRT